MIFSSTQSIVFFHELKEIFVKHIIALVYTLLVLMMQKAIKHGTFHPEVFKNLEEGIAHKTIKKIIIVANNLKSNMWF